MGNQTIGLCSEGGENEGGKTIKLREHLDYYHYVLENQEGFVIKAGLTTDAQH